MYMYVYVYIGYITYVARQKALDCKRLYMKLLIKPSITSSGPAVSAGGAFNPPAHAKQWSSS